VSVPSAVSFGTLMWTEARMPVPRLVGQEVTTPYSVLRATRVGSEAVGGRSRGG
jgi:hypothetical protein